MCGVFGWAWKQKYQPSKVTLVKVAMLLADGNDRRGGQSWGWWSDVGFERGLGPIMVDGLNEGMVSSRILMAHSRYATTGEVSVKNAHPLVVGKIIGAHNGTVTNHEELNKKYGRKYEVDSSHIFAHLSERRPLTELKGYGTIEYVYKDEPHDRVWLARMSQSADLSVARVLNRRNTRTIGVVWSSVRSSLKSALEACNLPYVIYSDPRSGVLHSVTEDGLWVYRDVKMAIGDSFGRSYSKGRVARGGRGHQQDYDYYSFYGDEYAETRSPKRNYGGSHLTSVGSSDAAEKAEKEEHELEVLMELLVDEEGRYPEFDTMPALEMLTEADRETYLAVRRRHKAPDEKFAEVLLELNDIRSLASLQERRDVKEPAEVEPPPSKVTCRNHIGKSQTCDHLEEDHGKATTGCRFCKCRATYNRDEPVNYVRPGTVYSTNNAPWKVCRHCAVSTQLTAEEHAKYCRKTIDRRGCPATGCHFWVSANTDSQTGKSMANHILWCRHITVKTAQEWDDFVKFWLGETLSDLLVSGHADTAAMAVELRLQRTEDEKKEAETTSIVPVKSTPVDHTPVEHFHTHFKDGEQLPGLFCSACPEAGPAMVGGTATDKTDSLLNECTACGVYTTMTLEEHAERTCAKREKKEGSTT